MRSFVFPCNVRKATMNGTTRRSFPTSGVQPSEKRADEGISPYGDERGYEERGDTQVVPYEWGTAFGEAG